MQHKKISLILMKPYFWQGLFQLSGNKQPIVLGIGRVFAISGSLLALMLLSACTSTQSQQKPIPQPPQNQQESSSKQSTQSSADLSESTPEPDGQLPKESSTQDSQSPSDLNEELSESLGAFDEVLLSEQEKIDNNRPFDSSGQSTGFESDADNDIMDKESTGSYPQESTETADSDQDAEQQTTGQSTSTGVPSNQTPKSDGNNPGVDGSDDDIVARQLREAAEKEQDPQLKAKLWEEYYRYKQENSNE